MQQHAWLTQTKDIHDCCQTGTSSPRILRENRLANPPPPRSGFPALSKRRNWRVTYPLGLGGCLLIACWLPAGGRGSLPLYLGPDNVGHPAAPLSQWRTQFG